MSKEFKDKYIYNGDDLGAAYSKMVLYLRYGHLQPAKYL